MMDPREGVENLVVVSGICGGRYSARATLGENKERNWPFFELPWISAT
jgi:hypothetical protein